MRFTPFSKQALLSVGSLFISTGLYAQSIDFSGDGAESDIVSVTIDDDDNIDWQYLSSDSDFATREDISNGGDVGESGDNLVPGPWTGSGNQVAYTTRDGKKVNWVVLDGSSETSVEFGLRKDKYLIPGDFNGNGTFDAARISSKSAIRVMADPFNSGSATYQGNFLKKHVKQSQDAFRLNLTGDRDQIGIVRKISKNKRFKIYLKDVLTNASTTQKLIGLRRGGIKDAVPLRQADGTDALAIIHRKNGVKSLHVFDPETGESLYSKEFSNIKNYGLAGDYDRTKDGEEFAVIAKDNTSMTIISVFDDQSETTVSITNSDDVLADDRNVHSYKSNTSGGGGGGGSCSGTTPFGAGRLWKPEADANDARQHKPVMLLTGSNKNGNSGKLTVYSSNGVAIGSVGFKASSIPGVNNGAHHYFSGGFGSGHSCSQFRSLSQAAGGNGDILVQWKGSTCLGPQNPCSRAGGV